jgi:hypothetical protein
VTSKLKLLLTSTVAFLLGTLYAGSFGLISHPLRACLIAWPIWIVLFWFLLWRFNLIRKSGFLAALPMTILGLEITRSIHQPPQYAFQLISLDRSHYTPRTRVPNRNSVAIHSDITESAVKELYIGEDGFRADPETERGNPARCHDVLIGDSMIHGLGLPYRDTLRPVLERMNVNACVFGVAGNSPVDYLSTLNYVRDRIDDGAHIAIYLYTYNDFISLVKYVERTTRGLSPSFVRLAGVINYYDDWRRTTFVYGLLKKSATAPQSALRAWRLRMGGGKEIEVYWDHDPSHYQAAPPLTREQRATFLFFLQQLRNSVANRPWKVSIVFIPDNEEMLANLARPSSTFQDMDPRRIEALKICAERWSDCRDLTPYLFERTIAERQSPYLLKDRHFSLFGNRVLAEHYESMRKLRLAQSQ